MDEKNGKLLYRNSLITIRLFYLIWFLFLSIAVFPVFSIVPSAFKGLKSLVYIIFGYVLVPLFILISIHMILTLHLEIYENGIKQTKLYLRSEFISFSIIRCVVRDNMGKIENSPECKVSLMRHDGNVIYVLQPSLSSGDEIYNELMKAFDAYKARENHD